MKVKDLKALLDKHDPEMAVWSNVDGECNPIIGTRIAEMLEGRSKFKVVILQIGVNIYRVKAV